jgi:hypothetical protein
LRICCTNFGRRQAVTSSKPRIHGHVWIVFIGLPGEPCRKAPLLAAKLWQAVVDRKRQQEALVEMVDKLAFKLPLLDFYQQVFPTNAMKIVVAELYIEILGFLEEAFLYYRNGRLSERNRLRYVRF